jgi:exopolyphosphatase/guanosine-5'-triphosphate,3'-diphosphate pyrophosphatase
MMEELEIEELEVPQTGLRAGVLAELRLGRAALAA